MRLAPCRGLCLRQSRVKEGACGAPSAWVILTDPQLRGGRELDEASAGSGHRPPCPPLPPLQEHLTSARTPARGTSLYLDRRRALVAETGPQGLVSLGPAWALDALDCFLTEDTGGGFVTPSCVSVPLCLCDSRTETPQSKHGGVWSCWYGWGQDCG